MYNTFVFRVVVLANSYAEYSTLIETLNLWPSLYRDLLDIEFRPIYKPSSGTDILKVYENCATEKLFLPWALPDLDAGVFLDTDTFFLTSPQELLQQFQFFDDQQVFGFPPVDGYYSQFNVQVR